MPKAVSRNCALNMPCVASDGRDGQHKACGALPSEDTKKPCRMVEGKAQNSARTRALRADTIAIVVQLWTGRWPGQLCNSSIWHAA